MPPTLSFTHPSIRHVSLLKINVERAEEEVLLGVEPRHWPYIAQVQGMSPALQGEVWGGTARCDQEECGLGMIVTFTVIWQPPPRHRQVSPRPTVRCPLNPLSGIPSTHCQVSLQLHDLKGRADRLEAILRGPAGFGAVLRWQEPRFKGSSLWMMYASRRSMAKQGVEV